MQQKLLAIAGPGRKPAERAGAIFRRNGIADISLKDARGSAAESLHDPAQEQQPNGIGKPKNKEGGSRGAESNEQGRTASVMIGDAAPNRSRYQLGNEE